MRTAAILALLLTIVTNGNAAEIASVAGKDIEFKGLNLGVGVEDVLSKLGQPKQRLRFAFENGPDEKLYYAGLEFWIYENEVSALILSGRGLMLDSGLTVGSPVGTTEGVETLRIGESDCVRAVEWKEGKVISIKLFCAN